VFDFRDIAERAISTVVQAFVGALPAGFALTDLSALKVAALAGVAAGVAFVLSVVKNLAVQAVERGQELVDLAEDTALYTLDEAREVLLEAAQKLS
jgi:hypothetical protein